MEPEEGIGTNLQEKHHDCDVSSIKPSQGCELQPITPQGLRNKQQNTAQSWYSRISSSASGPPVEKELATSQIRNRTPIRTVFDDLPTAHSSITSGSLRDRYRIPSFFNSDTLNHDRQVLQDKSLQDIGEDCIHHDVDTTVPREGALGGLSSQPKNNFASTTFTNTTYTSHGSVSECSIQGTPTPMLINSSASEQPSKNIELTCTKAAPDGRSFEIGDLPSSSNQPLSTHVIPDEPSSPIKGSTLGNLYTRYMQYSSDNSSSGLEDGHQRMDSSSLSKETKPGKSAMDESDPESSGIGNVARPEAAIPQLSVRQARILRRSKRMITRNGRPVSAALPNLWRRCSINSNNTLNNNSGSTVADRVPGNQLPITISPLTVTSNNPFRSPQPQTPNQSMNEEPGLSNIGNRMPLERDVSSALRRLSSYSAFSEGSSEAQDMLGEGLNLQSSAPDIHNRSLPLASPDRQLRSEVENSDEGELSNGSEHTQTFYQQGAVAASWVSTHHQNTVRVPIFHDAYFPDSPPATPFNQLDLAGGEDTISHDQDDGNGDWETVGDSITQSGLQSLQSVRGMYGGAVKQAGSSLANISDEGSLSSHPNMNNFEFPARKRNSFFNRNSRQRGLKDIKDTPIPIFFPTRRTSKVNGYLGRPESSTSRYMRRPRPLTNHTNPFRSPPPNVNSFSTFNTFDASSTTNHVRRSSGHKNRNYLSRLRITSSLEEEDITQQGIPLQNLPPAIPNTTHVVNWIDESKGHRSTAGIMGQPLPIYRDESGEELTSQGIGNGVHDYHSAVTPNDSTDSTDSLLIGHTPLERDVVQGGIRHVAGNGHAQLPREPPGALYRNIRSVSEQRCSNRLQINNNTENVTSQAGADDNTQNAFRPFSLLTSGPSPTLDSMAPHHLQPIHDPNFRRDFSSTTPDAQHQSNGLSYRPYHPGPPSSTDWQMLYTDAQLQKMRDDARAAGTYDSQATLTPAAIGRGSGRLPRMTVESPHVYRVRRAVGDLEIAWRERRISIVVLCICNLFPPLLLLYATGYLDGIMVWWTKGKIEGFARSQKRVAFWLTAIWAACTIIGVACGIFYVVFSRHAS